MTPAPLLTIEQLMQWRAWLLPHWQSRTLQFRQDHTCTPHPERSPDHGMCRFTAGFLQAALRAQGVSLQIVGGSTWPPQFLTGGFQTQDGQWQAHYWLTDGHWIYDITASQFGADPVIITPATDTRYQANFSKQELREHLLQIRQTVRSWQQSLKTRIG